jgi:hypothetical protein
MKVLRVGLGVIFVVVVAGAGFGAARLIGSVSGTGAEQPGKVDINSIEQRQATEAARPRFFGQLLGISIAPSADGWPADARAEQTQILAGGCVGIPTANASALQFPRPLSLPPEYRPEDLPSATACSGKPTGLGWTFTTPGANGIPAHVSISRAAGKELVYSVAADRVSVQNIDGRDAIVIRPEAADGLAQISYVVFPESFGVTEIQVFNLSETGLMAVASAVAEASK